MRHSHIFTFCVLFGGVSIALLAAENLFLALFMGACLGAAVFVMIVAFPLDLSYREPHRGKRTVHVVMEDRTGRR